METKKSGKKRKSYFRFIQKMVEFYMSDANLRRDSFIKSKLSSNLELDMSLLVNCNRLVALEATANDVVTAIKPSKMLQLTTDGKVKRITPLVEKTKQEVDRCTLYVERLPPDATHDWLSRIFSRFGTVVMVTVPKYKVNKKIKGYAFIEFAEERSCVAAVEKYTSQQQASCQMCLPGPSVTQAQVISETLTIASVPAKETTEGSPEEVTLTGSKKRNRKKKKWQKRVNYAEVGLQVMSKLTWNELRDRYLTVQAANRRAVKTHMKKRSAPSVGVGTSLVPGSVLSLTAPEPVTDAESKALRIAIRQLCEGVEYVDVETGQQNGYVRTTGPEAAGKLLRVQHNLTGYRLHLLPKDAEHLYWVKIQHDRNRRLNDTNNKRRKHDTDEDGKRKNVSGARRLLLRAERQLALKMRLSPNQ